MRAAELLPEGEPAAAAAENSTSYWKRLRRRWRIPAPIQDYRYLGRPNSRPIMDLDELHTPRYTSRDWARNILTMPMSRILRRITSPLMFNLCVSLSCLLWHRTVGLPTLSSVPHTLLGSALGLLLVFRTNTAYDRYWEARRRWGEMVDEARAFGSLACTVLPIQHAEPLLSLIASFPWVLKNHLRCERSSRPLRRLLANETFEALIHSENQPLFLLAKMRRLTHASKAYGVMDKEREMLLACAKGLSSCVGACERIVQTPIPLHYSRHTSRFLTLYCNSLPLIITPSLGCLAPVMMLILTWALFGILEIGHLIEEPFNRGSDDDGLQLLPLNQLCRTVRRDVRELIVLARAESEAGFDPLFGREVDLTDTTSDRPRMGTTEAWTLATEKALQPVLLPPSPPPQPP